METRVRFGLVVLVLGFALFAPAVLAARSPFVTGIFEGLDPGSGRPVLFLSGSGLKSIVAYDLVDVSGPTILADPSVVLRKNDRLQLLLPPDLSPGPYRLTITDKGGATTDLDFELSVGRPLPASVGADSLLPALLADLADAETLNGNAGAYYLDAGNLTGTLGTNIFSAYADLTAEGRVGTGASQVARGDHGHDGQYATLAHNHDASYAPRSFLGAKVHLASDMTVEMNVDTLIPFDGESFDTGGFHSNTVNPTRVTCSSPGYYQVDLSVKWEGPVLCTLRLKRSGTVVDTKTVSKEVDQVSHSTILHFDQGEYLEVEVVETLFFTFDVVGGSGATTLSVYRIGE